MQKFKAVQRHNPLDPEAPNKFYASPIYTGSMDLKELSDEVAEKSSLTRGDCYNVIQNFLGSMKKALNKGYIVKLDDLGTFRTTLSSSGVETADELSSGNIRKARIRFSPADELKGMLTSMKYAKKEG